MSDDPAAVHLSQREMRDLAIVAARARARILEEIAEHVGPHPDDGEAASLYHVVVALCLGDAVQRAQDTAAATDLINRVWRYCRWQLRLHIGNVQ